MKVQNTSTPNGQNANARFWVLHRNSWVKLTLSPKQRVSYGFRERDGEGFHFEGTTLSLSDGVVLREWTYGGRDCDGFIRTDGADSCPIDWLKDVPAYPDTDRSSYFQGKLIHRPFWQEHCASHTFDQTAQAANY